MEQLHRQLVRRAHLFDDAAAYEAGVRDALAAVATADLADDDEALLAGGSIADDQARVAAAMRAHPAAGNRPLRAVGGSPG